ncbi:MAG: CoA transferase [Gammaproteobacteria bacterium]|jgi:crotonobetainyl-CoA:carnitine CoA-transferase CaiB-like acyl-CoA transferase|nr:CoA transferase [Gammaproteobacteria bacterium]MBT3867353.1 CoA transferase [Gammaproteobacteria bacterium]MBT4381800.1 CoA transferase [Gammaproteobacteria bacterium]MBT4617821.1 CoA transferase [Gammaproteobacteria bacterium]MBT5199761.1 CoA transferase [Gammaproteobacteria bacterium]
MTLPLSDYTILDLTIARAGPTAVRLLADWGAKVIRIEPPPDAGLTDVTGGRLSPDSQNLHRNKRGMTINLKSADGHALFLKLAAKADVVVENFRKDVKYRLGIDYEAVKKVNPGIVYASVSGFGQDGPYSERPGVDQVVQGMSGLMSVTGQPGEGPMRVGIAISDTSAGMFLGQGVLMALLHREKTGEGSWVHTSLLESMLSKLDFQGARYTMAGEVPGQEGNNHPTNSPMGVFHTLDGMVNLAASTNKMFAAFTAAVGQPGLAENEKFRNTRGRIANRHELWQLINGITTGMMTAELVELANDAGCPCGPIYDIAEAFEDEHVRSLKMRRTTWREEMGEFDLVRSPINMSTFPISDHFERPGPVLGEHTDEVLIEMGFNAEDINRLRQAGAI